VPDRLRYAALACALLLVLVACGEDDATAVFDESEVVTQEESEERRASEPADADEAGAEPYQLRVEIPAIDVDAELVDLGLNPDRSMEVPDFGLAGWYTKGPRPGAPGPAVIAAHYDSRDGPDVFYHVEELETGDEVHVHREDGSTVTFEVEHLEQHPKDELPGDRIWGHSDDPVLRLITCGGVFDREARSYEDNVIAYAALTSD
jgi:LPXTG-site transpeptidase (sortase) family protein